MDFANQTIIITGGSGGIGQAIALAFAVVGGQLIGIGRNRDRGDATLRLLAAASFEAAFYSVDLASAAAVESFFIHFSDHYPRLNGLINCAGAAETLGGVKVHIDDQARWAVESSLLSRMGRPEEVANACLFLASPLASFFPGETLRVDGGLTIIDPTTGRLAGRP